MHLDTLIKSYGTYTSEVEEIKHDGTILSKIGLTYQDIKFDVSYNITIQLVDGTEFTGTINMELPIGNILNTGISNYEKKDFSDIIFKRN